MAETPTPALIKALAVCAELTGTDLTPAAAKVMAEDLSAYPEHMVMKALMRVRREQKGRLTIKDVIDRIDDGRPGPEEAWGMIPRGEDESVVWTSEMASAYGSCYPELVAGNEIPARMAFLERYRFLVSEAKALGVPVSWVFSPGRDPNK